MIPEINRSEYQSVILGALPHDVGKLNSILESYKIKEEIQLESISELICQIKPK